MLSRSNLLLRALAQFTGYFIKFLLPCHWNDIACVHLFIFITFTYHFIAYSYNLFIIYFKNYFLLHMNGTNIIFLIRMFVCIVITSTHIALLILMNSRRKRYVIDLDWFTFNKATSKSIARSRYGFSIPQ